MTPSLDVLLNIGGRRVDNRLYRAPLLKRSDDGSDAIYRLIDALELAAAAGAE